jgi:hypothetical protein
VLSVLAIFGLTVAGPAAAKPQQKNVYVNKNVHVNKTVHVNRAVHGNFVVGRAYNGHIWYGHNHHFWHGRWYGYGDGPCRI